MSVQPLERLSRLAQQNRSLIAILFVLAVVIYFMVAFADQAWRARQLQAEAAQQHAAIASIQRENDALRRQIEAYSSDAYIDYVQSRARRDLNLANPGETLLLIRWATRVEAPAAAFEAQQEPQGQPNWRQWVDAFSGK